MPWLHICSYGVQILNKSPYQFPLGPLFGFLSDDTEALQRDWQKIPTFPTFPILIRLIKCCSPSSASSGTGYCSTERGSRLC